MRFEKITDNKIKIFFSFDDMNKNHISRKILFSNNAFSQNFIQSVLKSAEQNLNFKIENENVDDRRDQQQIQLPAAPHAPP